MFGNKSFRALSAVQLKTEGATSLLIKFLSNELLPVLVRCYKTASENFVTNEHAMHETATRFERNVV